MKEYTTPEFEQIARLPVEPVKTETSAVEKWNRAAKDIDILTNDEWEKRHHDKRGLALGLRDYGNLMRDELQVRISDLESQVNIIADENQSLEKRVEEKDAKIERLKQTPRCEPMDDECPRKEPFDPSGITHRQPLPESPELSQVKKIWNMERCTVGDNYEYYKSETIASHIYIVALELELARLRGGK